MTKLVCIRVPWAADCSLAALMLGRASPNCAKMLDASAVCFGRGRHPCNYLNSHT